MNKIALSQIIKDVVLNNNSTSFTIDVTNIYVYFLQIIGTNGVGSAGTISIDQSIDGLTYHQVVAPLPFAGNYSNLYSNTFPAKYLRITIAETNAANITFNVKYMGKSF